MNTDNNNRDEGIPGSDVWIQILVVAIVIAVLTFIAWLDIPLIPPLP